MHLRIINMLQQIVRQDDLDKILLLRFIFILLETIFILMMT